MLFCHFPKYNVYISLLAKAGNKSVRWLFCQEHGLSKDSIWSPKMRLVIGTPPPLPNKFYLIVRDPYYRIVSTFTDKILGCNERYNLPIAIEILNYYQADFSHKITFEQFLEYLIARKVTDEHIVPMVDLYPQYDRCNVYKLENIDDFNAELKELGFQYTLTEELRNTPITECGTDTTRKSRRDLGEYVGNKNYQELKALGVDFKHELPEYENFLNSKTINLINKLYNEDFAAFEYPKRA